jgi:protein-tyrosine phosphatase
MTLSGLYELRAGRRLAFLNSARRTPVRQAKDEQSSLPVIDIHCHPLSGVDDGAETFEVSVAMCKMAAADGITHVVATPHCNYKFDFQPEPSRQKLAELQAAVGDSPKLFLGCDFHLSYENIRRLIEQRGDFTINQTAYVLVELDDLFIPEQFDRVFYDIQAAGLIPILSHPERNPVFRRKPETLYDWVTRGYLVQVTAQSYTGGFGREAQHLTETWLERNLIHFFASDAHDVMHRPPLLSACYQKVAETRGREVADLLLVKNGTAVIEGRPMARGPEPVSAAAAKRRRRGWLSFLRP